MSSLPPPLPGSRPPTPIDGGARTLGIDAVRGLAVLGLIFANIPYFASAAHYLEWIGTAPPARGVDFWGQLFVELFIGGKCVALLAFLLGAGLAWQQQRAEATGGNFRRLAARRLGALFVIGLLHAVFLWWGDILCAYAILGALTLLAGRLSPRGRRWLALGLIAGWVVIVGGLVSLGLLAGSAPAGPDAEDPFAPWIHKAMPVIVQTYREGSFLGIVSLRAMEAAVWQTAALLTAPIYLGLAILGYDAVRSGWLPRDGRVPARARTVVLATGAAAFLLAGLNAVATVAAPSHPLSVVAAIFVGMPSAILLAGVYLLVVTRLAAGARAAGLRPLANVGRTALSNYLFQSVLAGLVFWGYGAGLYGQLRPGAALLVAAGIAAVELAWPGLWLARFRFGPMEALWRRAAYGRTPPQTSAGLL